MSENPDLLPKVRSEAIMRAMRGMPCALRVASFLPGGKCAARDTVVGCHLPTIGKGVATKVSDLFVAAGCARCHDIVDGRDLPARDYIMAKYPTAYMERLMRAGHETQARLVALGIIAVKGDMEADRG